MTMEPVHLWIIINLNIHFLEASSGIILLVSDVDPVADLLDDFPCAILTAISLKLIALTNVTPYIR